MFAISTALNSSALTLAVLNGNEHTAQKIFNETPIQELDEDDMRRQMEQVAMLGGHDAVMRVFLAQGFNPNQPLEPNKHLLQLAVRSGHEDVARTLLAHGADKQILANDTSLIGNAVELGSLSMVKLLVEEGQCDFKLSDSERIPLVDAAICGHMEIV